MVKVLKGGECEVEVSYCVVRHNMLEYRQFTFAHNSQVPDDTSVLDLKKEIAKLLNIPVPRQKILSVGRTLVDEKTLNSYATIKNGSKLTVVIKEPEPLKDVMCKIFKKFYSDEQSETMAKEFMIDFENRLNQMSLDDIERMATHFMERDRQLYGES